MLLVSCTLTFSATPSTPNSYCATATGKDYVFHHNKNEGLVLTSLKYPKTTMNIRFLSFFINTFAKNISRLLDNTLTQSWRLRKLQLQLSFWKLCLLCPVHKQDKHNCPILDCTAQINIFTDAKSPSVRNLIEGDFAYTPYPIQQHFLLLSRSEFEAKDLWHRITLLATEEDKRYVRTPLRPEGKNG